MSSSEHLGFEITSTVKMIKRAIDNAVSEKVGPNVSSVQCRVIGYISSMDPSPVYRRDIESHLNIRRSTTTELLQLMEKNGLVTNVPVDGDARLKQVVLTEKSKEICKSIKNEIDRFEKKLICGIEESEKEAFLCTLNKIKSNIGNK